MTDERQSFHWRAETRPRAQAPARLSSALKPLVVDRASSAEALVREVVGLLMDWLSDHGQDLDWPGLQRSWATDIRAFRESHGWRGPVAHLLETIDRLPRFARDGCLNAAPRDVLAEEMGLWADGYDPLPGLEPNGGTWNGEPLASGCRLPDRADCARALIDDAQRGEIICVHGYSTTVVAVISAMQERGLKPQLVLSEGSPDLGGRRMARELVPLGVQIRICYDVALASELANADRVFIGTEAIGPECVLARVGTTTLFQEARRREVPTFVLATADKWMPRGEMMLPRWCEKDPWLLWESAPDGVELDSQAFERVPLSLVDFFATECGLESASQFSLRALRTGTDVRALDHVTY
ncbi:MAG: hypothetical protein ACI8QZ_001740 [Chlamydiales bacterium]|jgi:hypothetical protein